MSDDEKNIFAVPNFHIPEAGAPPGIAWSAVCYRAYFENQHGEQWMLWEIDDSQYPIVCYAGGDLGWDDVRSISIEKLRSPNVLIGSLILNVGEQAWLVACFTAIRARHYPKDFRPTRLMNNREPPRVTVPAKKSARKKV